MRRIAYAPRPRDADAENFPVGTLVRTPSGRVAIVEKILYTSREDCFDRLRLRYLGETGEAAKVTLAPSMLTIARTLPQPVVQLPLFAEFTYATARQPKAKHHAHHCATST